MLGKEKRVLMAVEPLASTRGITFVKRSVKLVIHIRKKTDDIVKVYQG